MYHTKSFEVEVTVRNGFPVLVRGYIAPAEPDVGLPGDYFGDFYVTKRDGKSCDFLRLTQREMDRLEQQVWDMVGR